MERMSIPITGLSDRVLERLEKLGPSYEGWGREHHYEAFFVDVGGQRFRGPSLHKAISAALAAGGAR
jgi:hypothetical protein